MLFAFQKVMEIQEYRKSLDRKVNTHPHLLQTASAKDIWEELIEDATLCSPEENISSFEWIISTIFYIEFARKKIRCLIFHVIKEQ